MVLRVRAATCTRPSVYRSCLISGSGGLALLDPATVACSTTPIVGTAWARLCTCGACDTASLIASPGGRCACKRQARVALQHDLAHERRVCLTLCALTNGACHYLVLQ